MNAKVINVSDAFSSIYSVGFETATYKAILKHPVYCSFIPDTGTWASFVELYSQRSVYPEDRDFFVTSMDIDLICSKLSGDSSVYSIEYRRQAENLPMSWCRVAAIKSPGGFIYTMSDITAEKTRESQLEEIKRNREIFDSSIAGTDLVIWQHNLKTDTIVFGDNPYTWKRKAEMEYPDKIENASQYLKDRMMPESLTDFADMMAKIFAGEERVSGDVRVKAPDDLGYTVVRLSYYVTKDEDGTPDVAYGSEINITSEVVKREEYDRYLARFDSSSAIFKTHVDLTADKVLAAVPDMFGVMGDPSYSAVLEREYFSRTDIDGVPLKEHISRKRCLADFANDIHQFKLHYKWPDRKRWKWLDAEVNLVSNPTTGNVELFIFCHDITVQYMQSLIVERLTYAMYDDLAVINIVDGSYLLQSTGGVVESDTGNAYTERLNNLIETRVPEDMRDALRVEFDLNRICSCLETSDLCGVNSTEISEDGSVRYKLRQFSWLDSDRELLLVCVSDVTDVVLAEKEINDNLVREMAMLRSFRNIYEQSIYIDVDTGSLTTIEVPELYESIMSEAGYNLSRSAELVASRIFKPEYRDAVVSFLSLENLDSRFANISVDTSECESLSGRWYRGYLIPVSRDASGSIKSLIFAVQDIERAKRAEFNIMRDLENALDAAQTASRSKTEFVSRISHDIRTPIGAILNLTEFAKADVGDRLKLEEDLEKIATSGRFLLSLINDVLDIAKIDSGKIELKIEPYSFLEYISEIRNIMEPMCAEKGLTPEFDIALPPHNYALTDKVRCNQITLNIISNAVKYTPRGGTVRFKTVFEGSLSSNVMKYRIEVSDTGIGMSEEFLEHVFDEFAQETDNPLRETVMTGTGLGLAIVKKLVDLLGGTIEIKSAIGAGTTVTIYLPLKVATPEQVRAVIGADSSSDGGTLSARVLFAEDNEINAEIAARIFSEMGVTADRASNGHEALDMFAASSVGYYDAIFMDIQMPGMNGYEATAAIRALSRPDASSVPIIAMTADAFTDAMRRAEEVGMNRFTTKPLNADVIKNILKEVTNDG